MKESFLQELKRYVRFEAADEGALRLLHPHVRNHFERISNEFYQRLHEHEQARAVFSGPEQVARLKRSLCEWMDLLVTGPWDEAYYEKRSRIGDVHVRVALPQRYMFTAMNLIRNSLVEVAQKHYENDRDRRVAVVWALSKIIDIELAIMLESYRKAFVDEVQDLERKEKALLEHRLTLTEARYDEIVEHSEALIITLDRSGRILLFNGQCEEVTARPRSEALGKNFIELLIPEEARAALQAMCLRVLEGAPGEPFESPILRADGSTRQVRWHLTTLPTADGPILCALGIDVSEERDLARRTQRAERLAALGTLAAGLAHEIRNPLNSAHLQLAVVKRRLGKLPDSKGALDAASLVESELKRLALLVNEFLQFARPQPLRVTKGDLKATTEEIVALLRPEAEQGNVSLNLRSTSLLVEMDEEKIKQVIHNLVRNAIEATGSGGHVELRVERDGDFAQMVIEDDGPGLPSPDAPVFEPFFTTKESGTGLGLAIVHRIVTDHAGHVTVDSRPGRTVFTVALPVALS